MKKVIILRKIHVNMRSFSPSLKETKHINASAADLLHHSHNKREDYLETWVVFS